MSVLALDYTSNVHNFEPNDRIITFETMTKKRATFQYKKGTQNIEKIKYMYIKMNDYAYLHDGVYVNDCSQFDIFANNTKLSKEDTSNPDILDKFAEEKQCLYLNHNSNEFNISDKVLIDFSKVLPHKLQLKTLTGKDVIINIDLDTTTVSEFKSYVRYYEGIPEDQQRIIFNGKQLEDNKLLTFYDIKNDDMLHLIIRLRGGMYHEVSGRNGDYKPLENFFFIIE